MHHPSIPRHAPIFILPFPFVFLTLVQRLSIRRVFTFRFKTPKVDTLVNEQLFSTYLHPINRSGRHWSLEISVPSNTEDHLQAARLLSLREDIPISILVSALLLMCQIQTQRMSKKNRTGPWQIIRSRGSERVPHGNTSEPH